MIFLIPPFGVQTEFIAMQTTALTTKTWFIRILAPMLAWAAISHVAAAQELRMWTDTSGKFRKEAAFVKMESNTVHLKMANGKTAQIPLVKLSADDQAYIKQMASGSAADPFLTELDTNQSSPSAIVSSSSQSENSVRTVVGQGVGSTTEDAKKDAYRDAVRQVVGTLVATATLVENDVAIESKVLSLSGGFLNRVEMLTGFPKQEGTLWKVKIKAEVQVTEVLATLGKANVTTLAVRSEDLEAQRVTIADQQSAKLEALNDPRMWENFPGQFFKLTVIQQPKVTKAGPDTSQLSYAVELSPNLEQYKAFADKVAAILGKTGGKRGDFSNDGLKPNCDKSQMQGVVRGLWHNFFCSSDGLSGSFVSRRDQAEFLERLEDTEPSSPEAKGFQYFCFDQGGYVNPDECGLDRVGKQFWDKVYDNQETEFVLCMLVESNKSYSKTKWQWFTCDRTDFPVGHDSPWLRGIECEITFLDGNNKFVASDTFSFGNGVGVSRYGEFDMANDGGMIFVSPFWIPPEQTGAVWDRKGYVAQATFHRTSELASDEVKNVKSVSCRVKTLAIKPER